MRLRRPRTWLPFAAAAAIVLIALVVSASASVTRRGFILRAPDQEAVVLLRAPHRVCEGPVTAAEATQDVAIWGASVVGPARVTLDVQDARSGVSIATGQITARSTREYVAHLTASVPGRTALKVCLTTTLNTFELLGSAAVDPNVVMTGAKPGLEFSLALLNTRHSLLGSLPTAFSRAALFKPSWVGAWTFWLLAAALVAMFGLAAAAIASACAEDQAADPGGSADGG